MGPSESVVARGGAKQLEELRRVLREADVPAEIVCPPDTDAFK